MAERTYKYLDNINSPADLKKIDKDELKIVCQELRSFIIDAVSKNPGHLGSNLGVVELTVALHYVFDTPYDRIVWDVGHQAYGHKILTGRRDVFHTNRQYGGISGFPKITESEYDAFGVGHASTSISAALGMAIASQMKDEKRRVVAVIGDGSMTGGLAFEGLNNTSMVKNDMLIVLNDNQMAIDPINGGFSQYLIDITTSKTYNKIRHKVYKLFSKSKIVDEDRKNKIIRFNNSLKTVFTQKEHNIFEGLNIRYFGPVDGHDVDNLVRIFSELKDYKGPKVLHVITKKGKGYEPAEKSVTSWHAPGKFDPETGERLVCNNNNTEPPLFQDVFGKTLLELAKLNDKIVAITPAMPSGCSMTIMQRRFPERVFDVGIAEGHAVTFSAGLTKEGLIPFCNIYSTFMQRAYDSVIHDVALQKLPVIMCLDRAGIVGSDGSTHQGQFDMAYMRCIPNLTIAAPRNEMELRNLMFTAQQFQEGPFVIRYPRGKGFNVDWHNDWELQEIGKGECLKEGEDLAVITIGTMAAKAEKAINMVENETNLSIAHYDARFLKPLDEELLHAVAMKFNKIITIEDGVISGGFGSAVLEFLAENNYQKEVVRLGIPDAFIEHGSQTELYALLGLDEKGIRESIEKLLDLKAADHAKTELIEDAKLDHL
ncbi:MAG: 1-deoxy-D-xylulose-5-phosphate synthase [Porphyromonadaceae bacterium]|nr:1-deoxy-D-xylulose-5-phosphate synthase [Porphyromonadaceae bacterium]